MHHSMLKMLLAAVLVCGSGSARADLTDISPIEEKKSPVESVLETPVEEKKVVVAEVAPVAPTPAVEKSETSSIELKKDTPVEVPSVKTGRFDVGSLISKLTDIQNSAVTAVAGYIPTAIQSPVISHPVITAAVVTTVVAAIVYTILVVKSVKKSSTQRSPRKR